MVLASSNVGIETIAVLGFDTKELVHGLCQVLELHIASFTACIQQQGRTLPAASSCLGAHPARQMGQGTILILVNDEESTHFYYFAVTFLFF